MITQLKVRIDERYPRMRRVSDAKHAGLPCMHAECQRLLQTPAMSKDHAAAAAPKVIHG